MRSARFRELWNLLAVAVLTGVGFLSVYTARQQEITSTSLIYAAFFLALYFVAHLGLRAGLPDADPWLLPLSALLTAMGLTEIYRLNPLLARDQSIWIVVGLGGFLALILLVGDQRKLESYKYTLGVAAVAMLVITMLLGTTINGAKLWLRVGGVQVQPGEFAKLLLVIFLAGYLREKRELLTMAHRRILGVGLPAARHLGPLLAMTGVALGVVAVMNDMGTALLLYGIFLAMVYVATGRQLYTVAGLALFVGGSFLVYRLTPHVQERFQVWLDPWKTPHTNGYQIIQSIESIADGGIFGSGLGRSFQVFSNGSSVIPAAQTDGIYAVWANETGLAGAAGMLLIYLLFAYRGFKIASVADDSFSKLLASGLTFTVVLQAFLIVGGITRLIPLTGITLPFVSYGGSSVVSNFMLLALLLMVSVAHRRGCGDESAHRHPVQAVRGRLPGADLVHRLLADLGRVGPGRPAGQRPPGLPAAADQARADPGRQRPHGAGHQHRAHEGRPERVPAPLSAGAVVRPPDRVQHGRLRALRAGAVPERLPDRLQRRPFDRAGPDRRQAAGRDGDGQQRGHQPVGAGPAGGDAGPGGPLRRRRCDRAEHGTGAGDGLDARLQPEHGRPQLRQAEQARAAALPCSTAARRACTRRAPRSRW